jgi:hypothetical protein
MCVKPEYLFRISRGIPEKQGKTKHLTARDGLLMVIITRKGHLRVEIFVRELQ